jgi:four helix bundle protein
MITFETLVAFRRAVALMKAVYCATKTFPPDERYGLTAQLRRASISVMSNIAEGQGRLSDGEWRQFLSHARGSLFEIEAELIAAKELEFLSEEEHSNLRQLCRSTGRPLMGLIDYVRKQEQAHPRSQRSRTGHRQPATSPEIRK